MSGPQVLKIVVPEDHFKAAAQSASDDAQADVNRTTRTVRRPTRGISLKEDTFATIRLVAGSGGNLKLIDAGSRRKEMKDGSPSSKYMEVNGRRATDVYSNFLLQNVLEDRQEKQQILETFGEPYIFFFGQRARIMAFQGILANTFDFNWEAEWWWNYENYLRGTRCVENDARVFLSFDTTIVGGYIISCNATKNAQERNFVQFQFQLFVTDYNNFSDIGNPHAIPGIGRNRTDKVKKTFTAEELKPFSPQAIPANLGARVYVDSDGSVRWLHIDNQKLAQSYSEFEGLTSGPGTLAQAWEKIKSVTNTVLNTASQVLSGEVVRVPSGFAGAFSYDDESELNRMLVSPKTLEGTVMFSVFADNDDEYVGSSDHYGSALKPFTNWRTSSPLQQMEEGQFVSQKARAFWIAAGLKPDPGPLAQLASAVQYAKLGVVALNVAKIVSSHQPTPASEFTSALSSTQGGGALRRLTTNISSE